MRDYLDSLFKETGNSEEKDYQILLTTTDLFVELSKIFIKCGKFKDEFSFPTILPQLWGFEVEIKSSKLDSSFMFGTDENGFFLDAYIIHPERIKCMDDRFWKELLDFQNMESSSLSRMFFLGHLPRQKESLF
jgi:hypothetical protein